MSALECPVCRSARLTTHNTNATKQGIRRRRYCHDCGGRFSSIEIRADQLADMHRELESLHRQVRDLHGLRADACDECNHRARQQEKGKGRPLTTGNEPTRERLESKIRVMDMNGNNPSFIAGCCGVSPGTVERILEQQKESSHE